MAGTKIIKQLLAERHISVNELADKLNIKPQSMSNKLYRDSFSFQEMCTICDLLNADLKAITRDSQKRIFLKHRNVIAMTKTKNKFPWLDNIISYHASGDPGSCPFLGVLMSRFRLFR